MSPLKCESEGASPAQTGHGMGLKKKRKKKKGIPGRVDAAGLRGGRRGSGFSLTGGRGEGPLFHQYTSIRAGAGGHKTPVLALTRWVQSASRGPALDST